LSVKCSLNNLCLCKGAESLQWFILKKNPNILIHKCNKQYIYTNTHIHTMAVAQWRQMRQMPHFWNGKCNLSKANKIFFFFKICLNSPPLPYFIQTRPTAVHTQHLKIKKIKLLAIHVILPFLLFTILVIGRFGKCWVSLIIRQ
jgi:hypothetical protein